MVLAARGSKTGCGTAAKSRRCNSSRRCDFPPSDERTGNGNPSCEYSRPAVRSVDGLSARGFTLIELLVVIAVIAIVVFVTLFSAHHKWDQNELHYKELLARKEKENAAANA